MCLKLLDGSLSSVIQCVCSLSTGGDLLSSELQQEVEQHLLGAGFCETDGQMSPITAQLYATASLWANHNGQEEANGNEASLQLANQERGMADSNSFGGKCSFRQKNIMTSSEHEIWLVFQLKTVLQVSSNLFYLFTPARITLSSLNKINKITDDKEKYTTLILQ